MSSIFDKDSEFDKKAQEAVPDLNQFGGGTFARLSADVSLFVILERPENPTLFFEPMLMHNQLWRIDDEGKKRQTATPCLSLYGDACPVCDLREILGSTGQKTDQKKSDGLKPRKRVYLSVWWIPVKGATKGSGDFTLGGKDYSVDGTPEPKVLGLPAGGSAKVDGSLWGRLKGVLEDNGVGDIIGPSGFPIYIVGNGEDGLKRRYNDPQILRRGLPDNVVPPEDVVAANISEAVEIPTPAEVAEIVDISYPGMLDNLTVYDKAE